jgi:two-component system, OmpR family, sensor histidine kinase BaeS
MKHLRITLQNKLILSYLTVALITVLVVSLLIRFTSGQSLMNLVSDQQSTQLSDVVQTYYASNGSLDGFFDYYMKFGLAASGQPQPNPPPGAPPKKLDLRGVYGLVDTEYRALLPTLNYDVGQIVPADMVKQTIAVEVDGKVIAWILPDTSHQFKLNPVEQLYLTRSTLAIELAALAGMLAAVAMGFFLAGRLLKPIRRLTLASQALARGDLQQRVPVTSRDELGQLTNTFNLMSADLVQADQQRKRMTADIAHDLSTPLQIISGYVEMLEDGNVPLTPQRVEIIKTELEHLRRLVSDLKTLTQIDGGGLDIQLQPMQPSLLLERIYHAYQLITARQTVELVLDLPASCPPILVDEGRMLQVLMNLVDNALSYTPKGGRITLSATCSDQVQLRVTDSGSGIEAEDLPFIFDRFYRADKARAANSGKTGLGLAICKALVTAQGGSIAVESAGKGQGTTITITFAPAESDSSTT